MEVEVLALGRLRATQTLNLFGRIVGTADERVPSYCDSPGQPEPFFREPPLRAQDGDFAWCRSPEDVRAAVVERVRQTWTQWRSGFVEQFRWNPAAWANATSRLAANSDVMSVLAVFGEGHEHLLSDLRGFPARLGEEPIWMVHALLGFAPVLTKVVGVVDSTTLAQIQDAATHVRSLEAALERAEFEVE